MTVEQIIEASKSLNEMDMVKLLTEVKEFIEDKTHFSGIIEKTIFKDNLESQENKVEDLKYEILELNRIISGIKNLVE